MSGRDGARLADVKSFWESNPLWTGESAFVPGSKEFFEEHRRVYMAECFGGSWDPRFFPPSHLGDPEALRVLDLGCGIGFWVSEFARRGYRNVFGADLTSRALELTRMRLDAYGLEASLQQENAEDLSFEDGCFDHVNCQGVIHHTPSTETAVAEIARVLRPGGTASISVYYRNVALRSWPVLKWIVSPLVWAGAGLKGRGREKMLRESDVDEIVRLYDGAENPIGKSYTRSSFERLLAPHFEVNELYLHFFPARALPFSIPASLHRQLDRRLGFMIYASVTRRSTP